MDDTTGTQPRLRERVGSRAWVRTVGLVGGGLIAGGMLAGTVTAGAAEDGTASTPSSSQQEVVRAPNAAEGTTGDVAAAEDCPEDGAEASTVPGSDSGA